MLQCFNFLAANEAVVRVEIDSTHNRNYVVLTLLPVDGIGRHISTGYSRTQGDPGVLVEDLLPLTCQIAKDRYEGLKDE
jgi:hypothetical protein